MTGFAHQPLMSADQGEACPAIVVKLPERPTVGVMTCSAVFPHRPFMSVVWLMAGEAILADILESGGHVAGFARSGRMHSKERESPQVMIEAHIILPFRFKMAAGASRSKLALMRIIAQMATGACGLQLELSGILLVAIVAGQPLMSAMQCKFGLFVVVELDCLPGRFAVTITACRTIHAFMDIIGAVASDATGCQLYRCRGLGMADCALKRPVAAQQRERRFGMIKFCRIPFGGGVALITFFAKYAVMNVLQPVA